MAISVGSAAARSVLRSSSARNAAARLASEAKAARSPFRIPTRQPLSQRIFSCPMEMSVCMSMQPFHTATASALMTSMLTLSRQGYGWLPEGEIPKHILNALTRLDEDGEAKMESLGFLVLFEAIKLIGTRPVGPISRLMMEKIYVL
ncbi:hypothetical protein RJ639_028786 [Escallonia herrerae]|uniref:Protein NUCLEAR FUSION DEFECTIVE 6, chloroplastic/mitochondrial-like n=1 Tax=Escallonia herrerae TaxID=1293975 RepID=A0AA89BQM3_9ASTE|nr:hypothetical protein RJ639_028786 [Escallonia herrerae]